jgi:hypothetical protein
MKPYLLIQVQLITFNYKYTRGGAKASTHFAWNAKSLEKAICLLGKHSSFCTTEKFDMLNEYTV